MPILLVISEALFDYLILSPIHVLIVDMVNTGRPSRKGLVRKKKKMMERERRKTTRIGYHTRVKTSSHHCPLEESDEKKKKYFWR